MAIALSLPQAGKPAASRPAGLATCAALALLVNAGAIGWATHALSHAARIAAGFDSNPPATIAMMLVPGRSDDVPVAAPAIAKPTLPLRAESTAALADPTPHVRAPRARTAPAQDAPAEPVVFYSFREVDDPAYPRDDWNLDVDTLDALGIERLVFEVLVSDRGDVLGCTVLEPAELADDAKRGLEARIAQTVMLPAQRAGRLVASTRRIELTVAAAPPVKPDGSSVRRP